ncbi:hypothetical protein A3K72_00335 [Candidatus Woesearchaeota archaeon RBG_13_36_6]|nr:MAG: hypothetical protein A3K72_00335 [Candidatus Woesearchaeota archaeon RBG_13_36_6]
MIKDWIEEALKRLNRKNTELYFTLHILKDKCISQEEKQICEQAVRYGPIHWKYSKNRKICFKKYVRSYNKTYFVITSFNTNFIKIITLFKKKGKH